jgi:hypothetical protein
MQDYQKRVVIEKEENDEKATALSNFIGNSEAFNNIEPDEQERMKVQNDIMWQLSEVLGSRIQNFND